MSFECRWDSKDNGKLGMSGERMMAREWPEGVDRNWLNALGNQDEMLIIIVNLRIVVSVFHE